METHIFKKGLNDKLIKNSINVAIPSESSFFTYYKLKAIIKNNPQIRTIILGVGSHNFSSYYDEFIYGKHSGAISPKYYFVVPDSIKMELLNCNKSNLSTYLMSLRDICKSSFSKNQLPCVSGFKNVFKKTSFLVNETNARISDQFKSKSRNNLLSTLCIDYLKRIINLCNKNSLRLIFINTPTHKYYRQNIPKVFNSALNNLVCNSGVEYLDLSSLELTDSCYIPDGDHVSYQGSIETSIRVQEYLNQNKSPIP